MSEKIWNSFNSIGDDLIASAEDSKVRQHFVKKRSILKKVAAACVLVAFSITLPLIMLTMKDNTKDNFVDTSRELDGGNITSPESTKGWESVLKYEIDFENKTYNIKQTSNITLKYELKDQNDELLAINIKAGQSSQDSFQPITFDNTIEDDNDIQIPLENLISISSGQIFISFKYKDSVTGGLEDESSKLVSFYVPFEIKGDNIIFGKATEK